ncbi:MAG: DUF2500 domain-containing protein [Oscillospiraceae bacterium]|nr:DUF2500 domain-containing protein [Oscillospiraceae bacterium]
MDIGVADRISSVATYVIFAVMFLVIAAAVVLIIAAIKKNIDAQAPKTLNGKTIRAKVIYKRIIERLDPNAAYDRTHTYAPTRFYYVSFEGENTEMMELSVKSEVYNQLAEGDTGILTYQGTTFVDYIPSQW